MSLGWKPSSLILACCETQRPVTPCNGWAPRLARDAGAKRCDRRAADRENPLAAPLKTRDHSGLPPAYVALAEHGPLRDDAIACAKALRTAEVPTVLDRGKGLTHANIRAMNDCTAVRESVNRMCAWLQERDDK